MSDHSGFEIGIGLYLWPGLGSWIVGVSKRMIEVGNLRKMMDLEFDLFLLARPIAVSWRMDLVVHTALSAERMMPRWALT